MEEQYWPEGDKWYHTHIGVPTLLIHGFHDGFVTIEEEI